MSILVAEEVEWCGETQVDWLVLSICEGNARLRAGWH